MKYIFTILIFLFFPLYAFIDYPYGVTFQTIRTPLLPLDNANPGKNNFSFRSSLQWMNVWSIQDNLFIIDGEEVQLEPHIRYAFSDTFQVGISFPLLSRGGGILDYPIEKFHNYTGVTNGQRDRYKRNTFNVSYEPLGPYYFLFDPSFEAYLVRTAQNREYPRKPYDPPISPLKFQNQVQKSLVELYFPYLNQNETEEILLSGYQTTAISNPRVFWEQDFIFSQYLSRVKIGMQHRLPISSPTLASNPGFDTSFFIVIQRDIIPGLIQSRLGISHNWYQVNHYRFLQLRGKQFILRPAIDFFWKKWEFSLEYVYYNSPILNFGRLSEPTHQLAFVGSYNEKDNRINVAIIENTLTYAATPDIGFHLSYELKFSIQ